MLLVITTLERNCPLIASDYLGLHPLAKGCNYVKQLQK